MDELTALRVFKRDAENKDGTANGNGADQQDNDNAIRLDPQALHGLAGDIVRAIGPYSESDPAALLLNTLVVFGSTSGCSAHAVVNHDEHPGRLFVVEVEPTAK